MAVPSELQELAANRTKRRRADALDAIRPGARGEHHVDGIHGIAIARGDAQGCTVALDATHRGDPRNVEIEAAHAQIEQRPALIGFDVRRQHACRRARGAAARRSIIEHDAINAAHRQLARDGTSNNAGADDDEAFTHERSGEGNFRLKAEATARYRALAPRGGSYTTIRKLPPKRLRLHDDIELPLKGGSYR